ncbi:plasmalemma vesicle associated protein a [Solea solea]|uniref:plasmalemma vesicle associated protein a n=1 Tax=Solea solea TaxID=90069 RepID=UPI00272BFBFA|nr:plasmalemma vesicle associated protein a [Solea solea]
MYSSGYSQVARNGPMAQKKTQYRSKGKSCGYYMRIVFFFSSLIQSLIIVSLVLFLVYGKTQDSASTARIQDLEESFSRLSIENVALRQQRKNLTNLLNVTLTQKARNDWELRRFRHYANVSSVIIQDYDKKLQQCSTNLFMCNASPRYPSDCPHRISVPDNCNCGMLVERLKARLELVDSNFTQTVRKMKIEMDQTAKERDFINLEVIRLRRDKSTQEKELQFQKEKCKDQFFHSLSGVSNVSKALLEKIDSLFPVHLAFQLTCPKQREHLEQIRTNCTSLSRDVENKLQNYLDLVGGQVSDIQAENSRLKAENWRLSEDYRWCTQNRTGQIKEHNQKLGTLQLKHDQEKERLLMDKMKLNGEIQVLENNVKYKNKEVDHLTQQINNLNMSCRAGLGGQGSLLKPGWGSTGGGQLGRTGSGGLGSSLGSTGLGLNKFGSSGLGSSSSSLSSPGSSSSLGSTGLGLNRFGSNGLGSSSSSSFSSPGSSSSLGSTGLGLNKFGSNGLGTSSSSSRLSPGSNPSLGSTGLGLNKFGSNGLGSSSSSSFSSPGSSSNLGSTGLGLNKFGSTGLGSSNPSFSSPGSSSSLGSTGLGLNKFGSNGLGSSSSSSHSSPGSSSSLGSTGLGLNKFGSSGLGSSSSSSHSSPGSSSSLGSTGLGLNTFGSAGSGLNKQGSTGGGLSSFGSASSNPGLSSSGLGLNKQVLNGKGSSTLGTSSSGSTGSNPNFSLSGIGSNKPTSNVKSSPGLGSSSGSTGATSKTGSTNSGLSWLGLGLGISNSGQSKTGSGTASGTGRGTSSGSSNGGTGAGRIGGLGGGSVNVAQHLQTLQLLINPPGPEEKEEHFRQYG